MWLNNGDLGSKEDSFMKNILDIFLKGSIKGRDNNEERLWER